MNNYANSSINNNYIESIIYINTSHDISYNTVESNIDINQNVIENTIPITTGINKQLLSLNDSLLFINNNFYTIRK